MFEYNIMNIFAILMGGFFAIKFRYVGKTIINHQKTLNKLLGNKKKSFTETDVLIAQVMSLIIGIIFCIIGIVKLFNIQI